MIRTLRVDTGEFARRFCLHILPARFTKVRHYGLLANRGRARRLALVRATIAREQKHKPPPAAPPPSQLRPAARCPYCGSELLRMVMVMRPVRRPMPRLDSS